MSAEERRAARAEALARVAAAHRPLTAVFADLRGETAPAGESTAAVEPEPAAAVDTDQAVLAPIEVPAAPAEIPVEREPDPEPESAAVDPHDANWRIVSDAIDAGRTARQRFGDPYCPAPVCYGHDYRVLDLEVVSAEGVPPYAPDCNCSVIVD